MAAPERFAEMSNFSLATQAPSIHGTLLRSPRRTILGRSWSNIGQRSVQKPIKYAAFDPKMG